MKSAIIDSSNTIENYENLHAYETEKKVSWWNQTRLVVDKSTGQLAMRTLTFLENVGRVFRLGPASKGNIRVAANNYDPAVSATVLKILKITTPPAEQVAANNVRPVAQRSRQALGPLLKTAAAAGNLETLRDLIAEYRVSDQFLDHDDTQIHLNQALQMACKFEHIDAVEFLLSLSKTLSPYTKQPGDAATPLMHAMREGNSAIVLKLTTAGKDYRGNDVVKCPNNEEGQEVYEALKVANQLPENNPSKRVIMTRLQNALTLKIHPNYDPAPLAFQKMVDENNVDMLDPIAKQMSWQLLSAVTSYAFAANKPDIFMKYADTERLLYHAQSKNDVALMKTVINEKGRNCERSNEVQFAERAKGAFLAAVERGQADIVQAMVEGDQPLRLKLKNQLKQFRNDPWYKLPLETAKEKLQNAPQDQQEQYRQIIAILERPAR